MEAEHTTPATVAHAAAHVGPQPYPSPDPYAGTQPDPYAGTQSQPYPDPLTPVGALEAEVEQKLTRDQPTEPEPAHAPPAASSTAAEDEPPVVYPPGVLALPLGDGETQKIIHVHPPDEWTSSTQGLLRSGDFDGWADKALAHDNDLDIWYEMNDGDGPKIKEINALFNELERVTGQGPGKSRNSRRSSRSGLRR